MNMIPLTPTQIFTRLYTRKLRNLPVDQIPKFIENCIASRGLFVGARTKGMFRALVETDKLEPFGDNAVELAVRSMLAHELCINKHLAIEYGNVEYTMGLIKRPYPKHYPDNIKKKGRVYGTWMYGGPSKEREKTPDGRIEQMESDMYRMYCKTVALVSLTLARNTRGANIDSILSLFKELVNKDWLFVPRTIHLIGIKNTISIFTRMSGEGKLFEYLQAGLIDSDHMPFLASLIYNICGLRVIDVHSFAYDVMYKSGFRRQPTDHNRNEYHWVFSS